MTSHPTNYSSEAKLTPEQWRRCAMMGRNKPKREDYSKAAWSRKLENDPALRAELNNLKERFKPKPPPSPGHLKHSSKRKRAGKQARIRELKKLAKAIGKNARNDTDRRKTEQQVTRANKEKEIFKQEKQRVQ